MKKPNVQLFHGKNFIYKKVGWSDLATSRGCKEKKPRRYNNAKCHSLTLSWKSFLSHRNQFIDLQSKSMDWLLYDKDLRHKTVKALLLANRLINLRIVIFIGAPKPLQLSKIESFVTNKGCCKALHLRYTRGSWLSLRYLCDFSSFFVKLYQFDPNFRNFKSHHLILHFSYVCHR